MPCLVCRPPANFIVWDCIMELGLKNKKTLITGASRGIGYACASQFAASGADIIMVSQDAGRLNAAQDRITQQTGTPPITYCADLTDEAARRQLFDAHSDIDILVNNAGAIQGGSLFDMSLDDWRASWELKVFGYIHLCQLYGQMMKIRKRGTIVNIIGMAGRAFRADYICGSTGNAALIAFTQSLGAELQQDQVRIFGINPSATETDRVKTLYQKRALSKYEDADKWQDMLDTSRLPFGRLKQADEVAKLAAMCCSEGVGYLSGTVIDMDGGGQYM